MMVLLCVITSNIITLSFVDLIKSMVRQETITTAATCLHRRSSKVVEDFGPSRNCLWIKRTNKIIQDASSRCTHHKMHSLISHHWLAWWGLTIALVCCKRWCPIAIHNQHRQPTTSGAVGWCDESLKKMIAFFSWVMYYGLIIPWKVWLLNVILSFCVHHHRVVPLSCAELETELPSPVKRWPVCYQAF